MTSTPAVVNGLLPDQLCALGPDAWSEPFWDAAKEHRLVFAKCTSCGTFRYPAAPFCGSCLSQSIDWIQSTGRATLYTFTIIRHGVTPDLLGSVPYVLAVVDVDDAPGVRMITNIVGCDFDALEIGQALEVYWHDTSEATIPRFTPVPR